MKALLSTAEVAALLNKSPRFVRDEVGRKRLRAAKFGGELHFTEADVQTYIDGHMNVTPVGPRRKKRAA